MSLKLKIVLGCLVLVAGFLVLRVGNFLFGNLDTASSSRSSTASILKNTAIKTTSVDSDADGLPDASESRYNADLYKADTDGDGYLDGEEAVSGYDPTKKENDKISGASANLTDNFANRLVAGIFAGDLNPRNGKNEAYTQGLKMLSLATMDDAQQTLFQNIEVSDLLIVPDTEEHIKDYQKFLLQAMGGTSFTLPFYAQNARLLKVQEYFAQKTPEKALMILSTYERFFSGQKARFATVSVPESFEGVHRAFLEYFSAAETSYRAAGNFKTDPLLAQIALGTLGPLAEQFPKTLMKKLEETALHYQSLLKSFSP